MKIMISRSLCGLFPVNHRHAGLSILLCIYFLTQAVSKTVFRMYYVVEIQVIDNDIVTH